ncbi:MAG: 4-(cytidine 5'-diphospho)-2-C-methyl-D-erythritol kinase [Candidatus Omnitrophota bacterium]
MDRVVLYAPAKVNLFLEVLHKRDDGYHTIETLFEKIALFDKIEIAKAAGGISISSTEESLPLGKENIAYRAVELLEERCGRPLGVDISIEKRIPISAGLGGGSSDAAAVLSGVNTLYDLMLESKELVLLGERLGADVPLFIMDAPWAIGRERGDVIKAIESQMKLWHILFIPQASILSKEAYKWVDDDRRRESPGIQAALGAIEQDDISLLGKSLHNDLEGLSFEKVSFLKEAKKALLDSGAAGVLISGSGPVLFGIFASEEEVIASKKRVEERVGTGQHRFKVLVAPTLNNTKEAIFYGARARKATRRK